MIDYIEGGASRDLTGLSENTKYSNVVHSNQLVWYDISSPLQCHPVRGRERAFSGDVAQSSATCRGSGRERLYYTYDIILIPRYTTGQHGYPHRCSTTGFGFHWVQVFKGHDKPYQVTLAVNYYKTLYFTQNTLPASDPTLPNAGTAQNL